MRSSSSSDGHFEPGGSLLATTSAVEVGKGQRTRRTNLGTSHRYQVRPSALQFLATPCGANRSALGPGRSTVSSWLSTRTDQTQGNRRLLPGVTGPVTWWAGFGVARLQSAVIDACVIKSGWLKRHRWTWLRVAWLRQGRSRAMGRRARYGCRPDWSGVRPTLRLTRSVEPPKRSAVPLRHRR